MEMRKKAYIAPKIEICSFAGKIRLCGESDIRIGTSDGRTNHYDVREEEEWDEPQYETGSAVEEWDKIFRQYF
ncbi:MAG: hypothetical protein IJV08_06760 [Bacteroidaceae bacterium]|nr:hypothetical protein [Bacteroidaceae bacterium]